MKIASNEWVKKYVRLFLQAHQDAWTFDDLQHLEAFSQFVQAHRPTLHLVSVTSADPEQKALFWVQKFSGDVRTQHIFKQLLILLAQRGHLFLLGDIIKIAVARLYTRLGYQQVQVFVSDELSQAEKQEVVQNFQQLTGKKTEVTYHIDPTLIAGIKVVSQDYVWESSIAQKLMRLTHQVQQR